jgi:hypothetical protein
MSIVCVYVCIYMHIKVTVVFPTADLIENIQRYYDGFGSHGCEGDAGVQR